MSELNNNLICALFLTQLLGGTKLKDFVATLQSDSNIQAEIAKLRQDVGEYAKQFPTIGFEKETMKYKN
jgi:glycine hydroxymethyltransferase